MRRRVQAGNPPRLLFGKRLAGIDVRRHPTANDPSRARIDRLAGVPFFERPDNAIVLLLSASLEVHHQWSLFGLTVCSDPQQSPRTKKSAPQENNRARYGNGVVSA